VAGDEALVLDPPDRLPDAELRHAVASPIPSTDLTRTLAHIPAKGIPVRR
jgi:hypothetical protein